VASIPILGGRSLRSVKNRAGKVLIRLTIKTFPLFFISPIFHLAIYTLNKTFFFFLFLLVFKSALLTKKFPPTFYFPFIFTGQSAPLTKPPPNFIPLIFQAALLTKIPLFYFLLIFHWANYTLDKTFALEGKSQKMIRKLESEIGGPQPKNWGEVAPDFDSRFRG